MAHLITSFNSHLRDFAGLKHVWQSNLNWKNQTGRANLWHNNITQSADLYIGESFVKDALNLFVIPISKLAQSNLFPIYKFPKLVDKTLATLDYHIETLKADIANNNNNQQLLPNELIRHYTTLSDITIENDHFFVTPNLDQFEKNVWKYFKTKETQREKNDLISKISKNQLNTTFLWQPYNNEFCHKCGLGTYKEDITIDWVPCDQCGEWYHYNNPEGCVECDKAIGYWDTHAWKCDLCKDDPSRAVLPDDIAIISDDEEAVYDVLWDETVDSTDWSNEFSFMFCFVSVFSLFCVCFALFDLICFFLIL